MPVYQGYEDPYKLEERGIERLSIVYGVVPVRADGSIIKEDGRPYIQATEWVRPNTPLKVAKGLVDNTTRENVTSLCAEVKVAWQPSALGKLSLSRGIGRWPHTADLFTAEEIVSTLGERDKAISTKKWGDTKAKETAFESEGITANLDSAIDHPLGNTLLRLILEETVAERIDHAFELFKARHNYA
jgi:hypothetical protein